MKLLTFIFMSLFAFAYPSDKPFASEKILNYVTTSLPKKGILKKDSKGLVYVKIDNNYIHKLVEFIKIDGFEIPPYFGTGLHGAHITVMSEEEVVQNNIDEILECGSNVQFTIKECQVVHPPTWSKGELAYLITIEAPLLHTLREKYGLPKNKYDFHITIGIKHASADVA